MEFFGYIVLVILSIGLYSIGKLINKKVNMPPAMIYLFFGIIFGVGGIAYFNSSFYLFGIADGFLLNSANKYNSVVVLLIFFQAGYSIDLGSFTKSGRKNAAHDGSERDEIKLGIIPAYFEIFVMTILGYLIYNNFPGTSIKLSIAEVGIIASVFALNSTSLIIPACMKHLGANRTGSKNLVKNLIIASIADNFTPMPVILIFVMVVAGSGLGITVNPLLIIPITIVLIIIIIIVALILGKVITLIYNSLSDKVNEKTFNISLYALILFLTMFLFISLLKMINPTVNGIVGLFGIVIATFMGSSVSYFEKNKLGSLISQELGKAFAVFGMPIMFFAVGSSIDVKLFTKVSYVIMFIVITVLSIVVKSISEVHILKNGYTLGDKKYAVSTLIAKGITLVNFSVILLPILGSDVVLIKMMTALAAVALTITLPVSIILMNNNAIKWLDNSNN